MKANAIFNIWDDKDKVYGQQLGIEIPGLQNAPNQMKGTPMTNKLWIPGTQSALTTLFKILQEDNDFSVIELTDGEPAEQVEALNIDYKNESYRLEWGDEDSNSTGLYLYFLAPTKTKDEWNMIDVNSWHNASYEFLLKTYEEPIYQLCNDIKTSITEWYNSKED